MVTARQLAYFSKTTKSIVPLRRSRGDRPADKRVPFLWGDEVFVVGVDGSTATVSAKGHVLEVDVADLQDDPILSWYQIDCGQGDAALVQLPDRRWLLVDAGPSKAKSNSGAAVRDFIAWKTFVDQSWKNDPELGVADADKPFHLTAIATHPDNDHYAGFADLHDLVERGAVVFDEVFHSGLGRFDGTRTAVANGRGHSQLGPVVGTTSPDLYLAELIDGFDDVDRLSRPVAGRSYVLDGEYARWLRELRELHEAGRGVGPLRRVDASTGHLPGFAPTGDRRDAAIAVLGPVLEPLGAPGARPRFLDSGSVSRMRQPSLTRNGHSVVLRIDYHDVRLMLTGDLNFRSQAVLLRAHDPAELACHVAKACHHGSDDVSHTFLAAMAPLATLFSSGDNETHVHPRAKALALAAAATPLRKLRRTTKFLDLEEERVVAPLIYSTELSRSVQLWKGGPIVDGDGETIRGARLRNVPRGPTSETIEKPSRDWLLADDLVYGLINVRTDGERIVIAVHNEGSPRFQVQELSVG